MRDVHFGTVSAPGCRKRNGVSLVSLFSECSKREFAREADGYRVTRHQRAGGTGYFDEVAQVLAGGTSSTTALVGSTEVAQSH